jgi:phenylacetate-CoA ligase
MPRIEGRAIHALAAVQRFVETDLDRLLDERAGADPMPALLAMFHRAAAGVPAYAAFLRARGIEPASVRDADDWRRLPLMTKAEYFRTASSPTTSPPRASARGSRCGRSATTSTSRWA